MRVARRVWSHKFRIKFFRIVSKFVFGYCFQTLTANRQITVTLDPSETIHVRCIRRHIVSRGGAIPANFFVHINIVVFRPSLNKRPIKKVSIISNKDRWLNGNNVVKEFEQEVPFILFIKNCEMPFIFDSGRVFEIFNIRRYYFSVCYEKTLPVNHIRYHHYLIGGGIGKLEGQLRRFNVKREDNRLSRKDFVKLLDYFDGPIFSRYRIP